MTVMMPRSTDEVTGVDYRPRLELYDRRWEVYTAAERFVAQVLENFAPERDHFAELHRSTVHARFLFGSDINDYLKELISHAVALRKWNRLYTQHNRSRQLKNIDEVREGMDDESRWFVGQQATLPDRFMRYMDLSNVGVGAEPATEKQAGVPDA